ncbi:MAG: TPM domain-containing protein [Lachnospiraceae bacterium]
MKKYKILLSTLIFMILMALPVSAEENVDFSGVDTSQVVYDDADILTNEDTLKQTAEQIADTFDIYVALHTVTDITAYGYNVNYIDYYANDWYDANDFDEDAVFFIVDPTNRKYCILTKGSAISIVGDSMLDDIENSFYNYLSSSLYESAMERFVSSLDRQLAYRRYMAMAACAVIPLLIGLITILVMYQKSKSSYIRKPTTREYMSHQKTIITKKDERYIRTATQVRNIDKNSGGRSGGGGGRSVSSGGSRSGGRKGSF